MYFTQERIKKILGELSKYQYPQKVQIPSWKMKPGNFKGGEAVQLDTSEWETFTPKDYWGGRDQHFWFRGELEIPIDFADKTVLFEIRTGREGQGTALNPQFILYIDGKLIQGMDVNHTEVVLAEKAIAGQKYLVALHSYAGMRSGNMEMHFTLKELDRETEKLYYNIKVPLEVAGFLDKEDKRRIDILNYLNEAVNILDLRKPFSKEYHESVKVANEYLDNEFYGKYCGNSDIIAHCVGHTHIDVAWLWTLAQTREKAVRSFSTVLNLMKEYPEYVFMSSQPQLYDFVREHQLGLYEEIKERSKEGRWEPEGAMWLEADCNLASGESLVRQLLFGKRFFNQEFGVQSKILWLPDVFGYSAALPQILKKSGVDYFMTTKISWNEYNKMPYDTFMWKGIDGTEILTHFITTQNLKPNRDDHRTTYNGIIDASQVMGGWDRYQQKNINNEVLICYGYGDGGGGPTKEMLETARRMAKGIPGCPKVQLGTSLDYFKRLETRVMKQKKLPKWVGELYLEYHRGTYTSMARNKRYNRKSEFLYQDIEWLSCMSQYVASSSKYPYDDIHKAWQTILLNQFHDILPGSSIREVYEDSKKDYQKIFEKGHSMLSSALAGIIDKIQLDDASVVVFNQLGFDRSDIVELDLPDGYRYIEILDDNGKLINSQIIEGKDNNKVVFFASDIPSKGYKAFRLKGFTQHTGERDEACGGMIAQATKDGLSNRYFDIRLDQNGHLVSIYDKMHKREILKKGQRGNILQAFEDKPHQWDAWDINVYYQEKMWEINEVESIEVVENGPVRVAIRIKRRFLDSTLVQDIRIYNDIPRIDFVNHIDWKEKHILLKVAFPVDIHSDKACFEIQYGNVERPTHWNTSWDFARFEVCAHKWVDLSEDNYGVSLLNDCKYGHDIKDSVMRLSLIKSAVNPNENADREMHEFTYSLYPHAGDWKKAGTVNEAYSLNCPMYAVVEEAHTGKLPSELSLVKVDQPNVVIEVVKKAEDSDDIIIRLYECYNRRSRVNLIFFKSLAQVWECDLMENNISAIEFKENAFKFDIKPYEIKTLKLRVR